MTTAFYRTGTVAVTQNSKVVTGTGTNWTTGPTKPLAGDVFIFNNKMYEIDNVVSDTEIRLYRNFEDSTASSKSYAIMRNASLNISARIAAQVAQVVNQKQIMIDEFHDFLTNNTDSTVPLTDTLGNTINVTPIPMLDEIYNQATKGLNDKADEVINSQRARSEADMNQMRRQNDEIFDASGMVQMGKHANNGDGIINEGLYVHGAAAYAKRLYLGRENDGRGNSLTDHAVTNIAGFVSNIVMRNGDNRSTYELASFKLPEAPKGYDVADSTGNCRGSGKAVLNLRTEVDPKYGDIADSDEEAISRAWEGLTKNGDFRNGISNWNNFANYAEYTLTDGVLSITSSKQVIGGIQCDAYNVVEGRKYVIGFYLHSGRVRLRRTISSTSHNPSNTELGTVITEGYHEVVYTAPAGYSVNSIWFEAAALDDLFSISNISIKPVTEEVIVNPVDLTGLEGFLREVSETNPFVYPGGIIQSKATTMNGIATSRSNRPDSYYAVYAGDTTSAGLGVDFFSANTFDQGKMLADESNNLFKLADGRLVQFCIRNRAIRGAGNGDWVDINPANGGYFRGVNSSDKVAVQGDLEEPRAVVGGDIHYVSEGSQYNNSGSNTKGVWIARQQGSPVAVNWECYFLVLATIPKLNQGAYCKGLNEFGTAKWNAWDGTNNNSKYWYKHKNFKTKADCFKLTSGGNVGVVGGALANGGIWTGRPDGKCHDAIYASGLNGVIDHRLPAKHMEDDWLDPKQKLESAKFRGAQKLVWTTPIGTTSVTYVSYAIIYLTTDWLKGSGLINGDSLWLHDSNTGFVTKCVYFQGGTEYRLQGFEEDPTGKISTGDSVNILKFEEINTTVSGEYSVDTVVGDPTNLQQVDVLKDGFLGYWGGGRAYTDSELPRKATQSLMKRIFTGNSGQSWTGQGDLQVGPDNTIEVSYSESEIVIFTTTAYAYQTEEASNSPIVGGEKGVSREVWSCMSAIPSAGALFSESLLRKVTKSISSGTRAANLSVESYFLNTDGRLYTQGSSYTFRHAELNLAVPDNSSPAVKAQCSLVEENGQLFVQVQANELGYLSMASGGSEASDVSTSFVAGIRYRITSAYVNPIYFACSKSVTTAFKDLRITKDGNVIGNSSGTVYGHILDAQDSGSWGDDDVIKVTANGSDTFVDKNGITRKSVCHRTKFPIGWARTAAKVGSENSPA